MKRLPVWLFRVSYAIIGAAMLALLLGCLWRADFFTAAKTTAALTAGLYGTAALLYTRGRPPAIFKRRKRQLYAAERATQAFLLLLIGTGLLFAYGIFFSSTGMSEAIAGTVWLLPLSALPMVFILGAYVSYFRAISAVAKRIFSAAGTRAFLRDLR